jgi:hypothetical protein
MNNSRIVYRARDDATPQAEMAALVAIYKICLESYAKKGTTRPGSPEDVKGRSESDFHAKTSIHE